MRTGKRKLFILTSKSWALEETGNLNVKLCGMSERRRENGVQGEREKAEKQDVVEMGGSRGRKQKGRFLSGRSEIGSIPNRRIKCD
jgi:hypothetical protein